MSIGLREVVTPAREGLNTEVSCCYGSLTMIQKKWVISIKVVKGVGEDDVLHVQAIVRLRSQSHYIRFVYASEEIE
jgi:hypothetical protein